MHQAWISFVTIKVNYTGLVIRGRPVFSLSPISAFAFPFSFDLAGSSGGAKMHPLRVMSLVPEMFVILGSRHAIPDMYDGCALLPLGPYTPYFHGTALSLL